MDPAKKANVINFINSTLNNIPKYNFTNFIEEAIEMKTIFNSVNKNQNDLVMCINNLRAILRDNPKLFCPLFSNFFKKFRLIFKSENQIPNESLFLIFDILKNKENILSYYEKWINGILFSLIDVYSCFLGNNEINNNENKKLTFSYVDFLFELFIDANSKNINYLIEFLEDKDNNIQKTAAYLFFKNLNKYNEQQIGSEIDWTDLFERCTLALNSSLYENETKQTCKDIYIQLYNYCNSNKLNLDLILFAGTTDSAKDFQEATGYNTSEVRQSIRMKDG